MLLLPETVEKETFEVSWTGEDDPEGSGIGHYDIYVQENDGPWELWLEETEETFAEFNGEDDTTAYGTV